MKKIIMVDGNNLVFRSYYATAYTGNYMRNGKGFPTNALLSFANMINKIVEEEKPEYMIVAFDLGKTFRHEKYEFYKGGRAATPDELKLQIPKAKEMLTAMGIKYYEIENYEADDIIGTFAAYCDKDDDYDGTIISSDKDLLQLISSHVDIKLLKQNDYIRYNIDSFRKAYGIEPINIIDLKALMGDSSDNIPGVKGIGEKTALKLLTEYKTLDGVYDHIDDIKSKSIKEKLINDKDNAYMSYEMATIVRNVPMDINMSDIKYLGPNMEALIKIYEDLEFYSILRRMKKETKETPKEISFQVINDINQIKIENDCAVFLELDDTNYHKASILGMGVYNEDIAYFIPYDILKDNPSFLTKNIKYTYDLKKIYTSLKWHNIDFDNCYFDIMIGAYLLEYNVKDDIAILANSMGSDIPIKNKKEKKDINTLAKESILKAKFIYENKDMILTKLKSENLLDLFNNIEIPLTFVLADMEYTGFKVDRKVLEEMGEEIKIKLDLLEKDIYNQAGCNFNISSPQQLSEILFDKLNLPHGKKIKSGYSTANDVLEKIKDKHPIVNLIIEYRMLTKLYSAYIDGLIKSIHDDGKIHTIYTQTVARTGRLSSIEPNLQNIPIRYKYGRLIRKAFLPSLDSVILSSDYSQIELRLLAHIAHIDALKEAFISGIDIHTKTASDIFHIGIQEVTDEQRRIAKAVNFGIIYGISSFGLGDQINVKTKEAQEFIDSYLESYPGIKTYMDEQIKKAKELGYVTTLFNRKRTIPEINDKNYMIRSSAERIALNTPIQGTSADIIKKAMIDIHNEFKSKNIKSKMLVQVHDELVFDCKKEELEQVKQIVKDTMEGVYKLDLPLEVHIDYGDDWYNAK